MFGTRSYLQLYSSSLFMVTIYDLYKFLSTKFGSVRYEALSTEF